MRVSCGHLSTDLGVPRFQDQKKKKKIATLSEPVPFELISPIMKVVFYIKEIINSHNSNYTEGN